MKRFIITMLCVSVFFIGLGSIFESTSAKFKSDERALELVKLSRIAIGGDANINAVKSMSIVGTTTNYFEKAGVQDMKQGSVEINMQLPGQFSKKVMIGNPDNVPEGEVHKSVEVVTMSGDSVENIDITGDASTDGKNVFVIKKGDGDVNWKTDGSDNVKVDGDKIVIKKDDGTVEEIKIDGKKRIRVKKDANGNILTEDIEEVDGGDTFIFKGEGDTDTDGQRRVIVKERVEAGDGMRGNEMLRTTLGLLLTAPQGVDVSYKFLGTGNIDGFSSNIIEVGSHGSTFKLYLDASSNLPRAISYSGGHNVMFFSKDKMKDISKEEIAKMKEKMKDAPRMEHLVKFSDFRSVGGLLLPYRWIETVDGKQNQTTTITSFEINPANIADKFGNQKVFVRKMKSKN